MTDTRALARRADGLADRLAAVATEANGRDLIPSQRIEWESVSTELLGMADDLRTSDYLIRVTDQLADAMTRDDVPAAARLTEHLAEILKSENMSTENDAARARYAPILESGPERAHAARDGQDIADAFTAATRGQSVTFDLMPSAMETRTPLLSTGGSAIPSTFADFVTVAEATRTPMLDGNVINLIETTDGHPLIFPQVTAYPSTSGGVVAENSAIGTANPTVASVTLNPYKYANLSDYSAELSQDNVIRIQSLLAETAGFALGQDAGGELTTGNGSSKPNGIVTAAGNGGTAALTFGGTASTFFDYGDLGSLWSSVPAAARSRGAFMVSTDAFTKILTFRDDNGAPVLLSGSLAGQPILFGRPVIENPDMAAVGSASKSVIFGDLNRYVVQRVAPLRVEISPHWQFGTDVITIKVVDRLDGDLLDTGAVKYLVSANA